MSKIEALEDEIAIVKEVYDDEVLIQIERKGTCRSCSMNMLCMGRENKAEFRVPSKLSLKVGDRVKLHISPASRMISSFLIFIFPIIMMLLFFLTARYLLGLSENLSILSSFLGLLVSGIIIIYADRKSADKIRVEILEKV
ncbi:MAG: SoxR reducing system RseC family protein [Candidatus Cloacimonetes bacterium]|nr:SoxR reducing system RseC family protein [Candidatus Cloacimonadota bacterium]